MNLIEKGQLYRIWNQWLVEARTDCFDVEVGDLTLGMNNVLSAFVALSIGFGVTVLLFIGECIFRRVKNKNGIEVSHTIDDLGPSAYAENDTDTARWENTGPIFSTEVATRNTSSKSTLEA